MEAGEAGQDILQKVMNTGGGGEEGRGQEGSNVEGGAQSLRAGVHMQVWGTMVCSGAMLMVCYFLPMLGAG